MYGLTRPEDAAAIRAGAVFGNLILWPKARATWTFPPPAPSMAVRRFLLLRRVFRNAQPATIAKTVDALGLAAVQLHGDEDAAYVEALRALLPAGCQIWKAVGVTSGEPLPALDYPADRLLLDTKVGSQSGGTGQAFDWTLLAGLDKSKLMLAGASTPTTPSRPPGSAVWALISTRGGECPRQEGCSQAGGRLWRLASTVSAP